MGVLPRLFGRGRAARAAALQRIQGKFRVFRSLLDEQNQVLKTMSDLEARARGQAPFDVHAVRTGLFEIQTGISGIIDRMIELGGDRYGALRERFREISKAMERAMRQDRRVEAEEFVLPFAAIGRGRAGSVGGKNANLGEMAALGMPVPDGFAISAWAYHHFVAANRLRDRIASLIGSIKHIERFEDLELIGDEIRAIIIKSPVPDDLAEAIYRAFDDLATRHPEGRFAVRSSAIGEDETFTFAGQYVTFLNVRRPILLDCYREVLASKFSPAAIYYFLSHSLFEEDLAMGVGCMAQIDSASSGVVYTRDPLNPTSPYVLVNSIYGLGSYLVEGVLTPDIFRVSREDGSLGLYCLEKKPVQLRLHPDVGVTEMPVPPEMQDAPSLTEDQLRELVRLALRLEEHYGGPLDIEWAADAQGRIHLLQARPLRLLRSKPPTPAPESVRDKKLLSGGTTIFPGAGGGPVFQIRTSADLARVPAGAVLVSQNPSPNLIAVLHKVAALVTEVGGVASHMATLAREAGVPTVTGITRASELPDGRLVTVDATEGTIYDGMQAALIELRRPEQEQIADPAATEALGRVLQHVAPLSLINPADPNFRAENCATFHDITRFIHQKAMEEMFAAVKATEHKDRLGRRLKTTIPLWVNVVHLDPEPPGMRPGPWITEEELDSLPMRAFWKGVMEEGWPSRPAAADLRGFLGVMGSNITRGNEPEFSENSYAFIGREYMLLNLRMGYHFATIEALSTPEPQKNYIRMQFKEGGAPLDRRIRRIALIGELLGRMGFENTSRGDFLDAMVAYRDQDACLRLLRLLGRINIMTKQLDMALASDEVARWYTDEFLKKLGLAEPETERPA